METVVVYFIRLNLNLVSAFSWSYGHFLNRRRDLRSPLMQPDVVSFVVDRVREWQHDNL